jgi:hypothetical protein
MGRNLISLKLCEPSKDVVDGIVESCPYLQYLELDDCICDDEEEEVSAGSIKGGLKKLAKLKVNDESIRLGTDYVMVG